MIAHIVIEEEKIVTFMVGEEVTVYWKWGFLVIGLHIIYLLVDEISPLTAGPKALHAAYPWSVSHISFRDGMISQVGVWQGVVSFRELLWCSSTVPDEHRLSHKLLLRHHLVTFCVSKCDKLSYDNRSDPLKRIRKSSLSRIMVSQLCFRIYLPKLVFLQSNYWGDWTTRVS